MGTPRFRPVTPHTSDIEKLVVEIAIACEAWLSKAGCKPVLQTVSEDRTTMCRIWTMMASACSRLLRAGRPPAARPTAAPTSRGRERSP